MSDMHGEFRNWYAKVDLGGDSTLLDDRWSGIEALAAKATYQSIQLLVDMFLNRPGAASGATGELIRKEFAEVEVVFPPSENDAELALISEIVLALIMEAPEPSALSGQTATLVYSSLAGGHRQSDSATGLLDRAKSTILSRGKAQRIRQKLPAAPKSFSPAIDFSDCIEDDQNIGGAVAAREVFEKMATKVSQAIGRIGSQARKERSILLDQLRIQDEELDLLWWASNGTSVTKDQQIGSLDEGERGLIAAVEAADLTLIEPGPMAIPGLLEKAGVSAKKKLSVSDAINAADEKWLRNVSNGEATVRTPLHFAINKRLESPDAETWSAHWGSVTGINHQQKLTELEISHLFYVERLVIGAFLGG